MKRIITTITLIAISYLGYSQGVLGSDVWIKNNAGTRGYVYREGTAFKMWDSTANVYNLAQKLKLDSLYTKINSSIAVTGTFWQATQPVSLASVPSHHVTNAGTFAVQSTNQANSGVDIGDVTINNASGGSAVNIQDGGNSITVDGSLTNISGTISLPTGASTSALQTSGNTTLSNIQTSVDNISTWVDNNTLPTVTDSTLTPSNGILSYGTVRSTAPTYVNGRNGMLSLDTNGNLRVVSAGGGGGGGGLSSFTAYDSTGSNTSMTVTNLNSLANSGTVGWQSDTVINRTRQATDYRIFVKATMANTAPANDKTMYVYIAPFYYDGTSYLGPSLGTTSQATGVQGSCTIASGAPNNLILLGVLSYSTQNMVLQSTFSLSSIFGKTLPDAWSVVIINYTGAAVSASSNNVYFKPVYVYNH